MVDKEVLPKEISDHRNKNKNDQCTFFFTHKHTHLCDLGVKVFAFYKFPESWSLNTRGNLEHELHVDLKTFVQGFEQIVIFPWGEDIKITVTPGTPIVSIMRGLSIVGAGMGVGLSTGQRGDAEVVVKWTLGRENVTDIEFMEVMEVCMYISIGYIKRNSLKLFYKIAFLF